MGPIISLFFDALLPSTSSRPIQALGADFGGRPQSLRIKFRPPADYGLSNELLDASDADVALTARVCVQDPVLGWLDVGVSNYSWLIALLRPSLQCH